MPYIPQEDRWIAEMDGTTDTVGELNYTITHVIHEYIKQHGGLSYETANEAIGVLECAKLELYRTVIAPYENTKMRLNGSVSVLDLHFPHTERLVNSDG